MLSMKHVIKSKTPWFTQLSPSSSSLASNLCTITAAATGTATAAHMNLSAKDIVASFKEWFRGRDNTLYDQIFGILASKDTSASHDFFLGRLNLRLSESLVLNVLSYGRTSSQDVLSCLKFFDWAGRQPCFSHTRATFHAILNILSKAKRHKLLLNFLHDYKANRYLHRVRFYDTLVMGYALVGKPDLALQLFGKMRYHGMDLDPFVYHILLNALVEDGCYEAAQMVAQQISQRGLEGDITRSILVKSLCKQSKLEEAEGYLRNLVEARGEVSGEVVSMLVDALCQKDRFKQAGKLLEEFRELNVPMGPSYGIWLRNLAKAGKVDMALEFLKNKKSLEGYVPEVFRYNTLVFRLLKENRLEEVCDLFVDMGENRIYPDEVTMNAVLCFFSKAGMTDVALEFYNSRSEFGLSPSYMAYNYLINTLCGTGSIDEAYSVLRNSVDQGYFPGQKTFSILAKALCREGKLDNMKELLLFSLEQNFMPSDSTYDNFIIALCKARRVEDGYLIHAEINRINKKSSEKTYFELICGFSILNRGDVAARLLLEMQDKGYKVPRLLFRNVICCICRMENPDNLFFKLLEMQLSHHGCSPQNYNLFIYGAGIAKKPQLAREVFEMMRRSGIEPTLRSEILVLQSYLKSERISDALNFFNEVCRRNRVRKTVYGALIVGLCKANKGDIALDFFREMKSNNIVPSIGCYENLIQLLCTDDRYDLVVNLVNDFEKTGRRFTSFIGNVLLFHSLKTKELYKAWIHSRHVQDETSEFSLLGQLIGVLSGCIQVNQDIDDLEWLVEQCFPLDRYTYNILLRRLGRTTMRHALDLYKRMCHKGYEPNRWTYDIIVHGLLKQNMRAEAIKWLEEMLRKGYEPTEGTRQLM